MGLTYEELIEQGLEKTAADKMQLRLIKLLSSLPPAACWNKISREILTTDHPFQLHRLIYQTVYRGWDAKKVPSPAWIPQDEYIQQTNIAKLIKTLNLLSYDELHKWSVQNRSEFWDHMVRRLGIRFKRDFTKVLDLSHGVEFPQWFVSARLTNHCR